MRKLTYIITEEDRTYGMEFITDRTATYTEHQYTRHRNNCTMTLFGEEPSEETEGTTREIKL
jgi:hypothetical protein